MTELRKRMLQDLQLHGYSERRQQMYVRAVRLLAQHFNKPPDQISEQELRDYGFFSPRRRATLETIKALFGAAPAAEHRPADCVATEAPRILRCPKCGSPLVFVREILSQRCRAP